MKSPLRKLAKNCLNLSNDVYFYRCRHLSSFLDLENLKILGIESTCDDTCAAILNGDGDILAHSKRSQEKFHIDFGGVLPIVARNEHKKNIRPVIESALNEANLQMRDIDLIAVANEPGLEVSLDIGVKYARALCHKHEKPLIGVHHMRAHSLMAMHSRRDLKFPYLTILISGGHSILALAKETDEFYILGVTGDDPIGEALDKIARKLKVRNLGSPYDKVAGGSALELLALHGNPNAYFQNFKAPALKIRNCDFSFAFLKGLINTHLSRNSNNYVDLPIDSPVPEIADLAASLLQAASAHIAIRVQRAVKFVEKSQILKLSREEISDGHELNIVSYGDTEEPLHLPLVVSGGVACNKYITTYLEKYCDTMDRHFDSTKVEVIVPEPRSLCRDNGVMIAWAGLQQYRLYQRRSRIGESIDLFSGDKSIYFGAEIDKIPLRPISPIGPDIRTNVVSMRIKVSPNSVDPKSIKKSITTNMHS